MPGLRASNFPSIEGVSSILSGTVDKWLPLVTTPIPGLMLASGLLPYQEGTYLKQTKICHQVNSLAGVILQYSMIQDLIYAELRCFYMALRENCCFYTNHSRIIRNDLAVHKKTSKTIKMNKKYEVKTNKFSPKTF